MSHTIRGIPFFNEVVPGRIWLGNLTQAKNLKWLKQTGITHIVSVTQWGDGARFYPKDFEYFPVRIRDAEPADASARIGAAVSFIEAALAAPEGKTRIYIHCNQGKSRSGTIMAAFFIRRHGMSPDAAVARVCEARTVVAPSRQFMAYLERFQLRVMRDAAKRELERHFRRTCSAGIVARVAALVADYAVDVKYDECRGSVECRGSGTAPAVEMKRQPSSSERTMAEAATLFFRLTHKLQGIPVQNEILTGKIWLGQLGAARNLNWLQSQGITRVCSVTQWGQGTRFHESAGVVYHVIFIQDKAHCNILDHLDAAVAFIDKAVREGKRVLVHCNQGRSRSATVLTAYFIRHHGTSKPVGEHIRFIKVRRPQVCPNPGFRRQLDHYRERCVAEAEAKVALTRVARGRPVERIAEIIGRYVR